MSRLLYDKEGNLYIAHQYEQIDPAVANEMITDFSSEVKILQDFVDSNQPAVTPDVPAAPAAPQDGVQTTDPNQAAPVAPQEPVNTVPAQPTDQIVTPPVDPNAIQVPAPGTDPNANPVAPAVDPGVVLADPNTQPPLQ